MHFLKHYRFSPSTDEERAWRKSLRAISQVFQRGDLVDDVIVELKRGPKVVALFVAVLD
jgi:hypothetical protein